ncbi:glycosyltransferase family 39 protein [Gemmatimonadota bacterium]
MRDFRGPNPAPVLAVLLGLAGFGLGTSLVTSPELVLPLTFQMVFLALFTFLLLGRERDEEDRSWLFRLVAAAIGVRFLALLVVHYVFPPYFFALDAVSYERVGAALSNYWQGLGPEPRLQGGHWLPGYYHLNAIFHYVLGEPAMGAIVLNLFAGVWTVLITFKLAKETMGKEVAKTAALFTAFFPSLILWSVLNIRDSLAGMAVVFTVLYGIRTFRIPRPDHLFFLGFGLILLTALRDYMGFLCLAGLALGAVAAIRPQRIVSTLAGGTVLVLFLSLVANRLDLFPAEVLEDPFSSASRMRESLQYGATSAFGSGYETETLGGSVRYLPVGFAFLLFAPFPWAIETTLQAAAAPETLLWYPVLIFALLGMKNSVLQGKHLTVIPLSVLIIVTTSYALVEGNFGTAYRHRAQIMPLFFIFAAVGWMSLKPWFEQRRRMRKRSVLFRRGGSADPVMRPSGPRKRG